MLVAGHRTVEQRETLQIHHRQIFESVDLLRLKKVGEEVKVSIPRLVKSRLRHHSRAQLEKECRASKDKVLEQKLQRQRLAFFFSFWAVKVLRALMEYKRFAN